MKTGWVYILSNESMPGIVKVGVTSGSPHERASELHSTGVSVPFRVETAFLFADKATDIEQISHRELSSFRVSSNREFFRCSPQDAADAVIRAATQVSEQILKADPVILSADELEARKRKAEEEREEQRRYEEWRKKPCERVHWIQIYRPYHDHQGMPYVEQVDGKMPSYLIWGFSECDCKHCHEERTIYFRNPRHPKEANVEFLDGWADRAKRSENSQLEDLAASHIASGIQKYDSLDQNGKAMYMERYRLIVQDEMLLSGSEFALVRYNQPVILFGVSWEVFGGGWTVMTREGFFQKMVEKRFRCKAEALSYFRAKHKEDPDLPSKISEYPCPCDRCRSQYIEKQNRQNASKSRF